MDLNSLTAVSPLDGRYSTKTSHLRELVSEYGLIKARVRVEAEWLSFLGIQAQLPELSDFGQTQVERLQPLIRDFSAEQAAQIKAIEKTTNHDVKAVEYFIKDFIKLFRDLFFYLLLFKHGKNSEKHKNKCKKLFALIHHFNFRFYSWLGFRWFFER